MDRSERPLRQRSRGATLAVMAIMIAVALFAASCSGDDTPEQDSELGSGSGSGALPETTAPATEPSDETGAVGPEDRGEPIEMTPTASFQRLDPSRFADTLPSVLVNDIVALDDGGWLVAGALADGRSRTRDPVAVRIDPDRPDGDSRVVLPGIGAGPATASGIAQDDQGYVAVGWEADADGGDRAVVWTAADPTGDWTAATLPSTTGGRHRAERVVIGSGVRYAIGSVGEAGSIRPAVWRGRGPAWELLTVVEADQAGRSTAAGEDVISILGATVTSGGLVAVGLSEAAGRDPRPLVWRELGDRMVLEDGAGLPDGGSLRDVLVDVDGSLLAVGAATDNGRSEPLVARADGPGGPWSTRTVDLDLAGWISFDGLEFDRVTIDAGGGRGPVLFASLTDPVVQHVFRSTDGGGSWDRVGDLAADSGRDAPLRALAVDADGAVAAVGGVVARIDQDPIGSDGGPGWWATLTGPDLLPDRSESLIARAVAGGDGGFVIGGMAASRSAAVHQIDAVIWRSTDGRRWERRPLDETFGYAIDEVFVTGDGGLGGLKSGGSYFTDVHLVTPDGEAGGGDDEHWRSRRLPIGEAFLVEVAPGPGRTLVAAGNRPDDQVTFVEPLFVVIEPDGATREIPLTDSPIAPGTNGEVVCLAGGPGGMLAVLSWGHGRTGVAVSPNGERWRGLDQVAALDRLRVRACGRDVDGRFVAVGQDGSGRAAVASSDDGTEWTVATLGEPGVVLGVDRLDDRLILSGAVAGADGRGRDGALWARQGDRWRRLDVAGLEGDPFAPTVEITGLAVAGDVVVAVGTDQGRAGAWIATAAALDG